jgi:hypothetical protein
VNTSRVPAARPPETWQATQVEAMFGPTAVTNSAGAVAHGWLISTGAAATVDDVPVLELAAAPDDPAPELRSLLQPRTVTAAASATQRAL